MITIKRIAMSVALAFAAHGVSAAIIYQDDFDGTGDLDGTAPDIRPGSETWVADVNFDADGTVGTDTTSSAWLPFQPTAGFVYELTATFEVPLSTGSSWLSVGFAEKNDTGFRFVDGNVNGYGTFIRRRNLDVGTFPGVGTNGSGSSSALTAQGPVTVQITLDATDASAANWTVAFSAVDSSNNTYNRSATTVASGSFGDIKYVGFSNSSNAGATISSLELEQIPEPSTYAALVGLVALGFIAWRRRR